MVDGTEALNWMDDAVPLVNLGCGSFVASLNWNWHAFARARLPAEAVQMWGAVVCHFISLMSRGTTCVMAIFRHFACGFSWHARAPLRVGLSCVLV